MSEPVDKRCDAVITAVRVFARSRRGGGGAGPERDSPRLVKRRYPREVLVFDTETLSDPAQRLMVGTWRVYRDRHDQEPGVTCTEEGFFYPDDLPRRDPKGFAILRDYVEDERNRAETAPGMPKRLKLWPLSEWVEKRLWRCGWWHRRYCHVVGFNLPFDLGRVASHWGAARGNYKGGWSLAFRGRHNARGVWKDKKYSRRLLMRAIDPRRTLFAWGKETTGFDEDSEAEFWQPETPFLDLHTLVFALTDENHDLVRACAAFGDPWKKVDVTYGKITKKLLRYAREDVRHTAALYRGCMAELARHTDVPLVPYALYSPATVGTEYLKAMGVHPPMEKFSLDERIYGWSMAAFFGGRAEARIVRTPMPVTLLDAASMYPSVNALLGTWRLMAAEELDEVDATQHVRDLLASEDLIERCFTRAFWREEIGVTLVELARADGNILPARVYWDPEDQDPGIGVNPLTYEGTCWYMLPDLIASVALGAKAPAVFRAIRLKPIGVQSGLRAVSLRGGPIVDPADATTDPFVKMVEERRRVEADMTLSEEERKRLGKFLKITANSTSYGVLARFDRREKSGKVLVFGPDEEPRTETVPATEKPGPFCFPPVAATLTAAARLMLALLEHEVAAAGGTYAFCDTDSLAIVSAPDGGKVACATESGSTVEALSRREIDRIIGRFTDLNPYSEARVPTLWDGKHGSLDDPVMCYVISAKRYALYRERDGEITFEQVVDRHAEAGASEDDPGDEVEEELTDWSEHGLGLYLDPIHADHARDEQHRRIWMRQAWEWIVRDDPFAPMPAWATSAALTRFTVSSPKLAGWFAGFDASVPKAEHVRPGAFGLMGHPVALTEQREEPTRPARSYESDPRLWERGPWYDRKTGAEIAVTASSPAEDPERFANQLASGAIKIQTLGEVLARFRLHPEHKSLAPDGSWAGADMRGLLRRRPVASAPVLTDLTGKEGNKLIERLTGEVTDPKEYRADYGSRVDRWATLVLPTLREMRDDLGTAEVAEQVQTSRRSIERVLYDGVMPHSSTRVRYLNAARLWCRERLLRAGWVVGPDPTGTIWCYREHLSANPVPICAICGRPVAHPLAKYCGETCKKRAYRERRNRRHRARS